MEQWERDMRDLRDVYIFLEKVEKHCLSLPKEHYPGFFQGLVEAKLKVSLLLESYSPSGSSTEFNPFSAPTDRK